MWINSGTQRAYSRRLLHLEPTGVGSCKTGNHRKNAYIMMLPLIDLNPNDETCIYSTLLYIIEQSKRLNIEIPSVTFDQPLNAHSSRDHHRKIIRNCTTSWRISSADVILRKHRYNYGKFGHGPNTVKHVSR